MRYREREREASFHFMVCARRKGQARLFDWKLFRLLLLSVLERKLFFLFFPFERVKERERERRGEVGCEKSKSLLEKNKYEARKFSYGKRASEFRICWCVCVGEEERAREIKRKIMEKKERTCYYGVYGKS